MGSGTNDVALQKASLLPSSLGRPTTLHYSGHYEFSSLGPGRRAGLLAQVLCPWQPSSVLIFLLVITGRSTQKPSFGTITFAII